MELFSEKRALVLAFKNGEPSAKGTVIKGHTTNEISERITQYCAEILPNLPVREFLDGVKLMYAENLPHVPFETNNGRLLLILEESEVAAFLKEHAM